jgi:hypothetical protein
MGSSFTSLSLNLGGSFKPFSTAATTRVLWSTISVSRIVLSDR